MNLSNKDTLSIALGTKTYNKSVKFSQSKNLKDKNQKSQKTEEKSEAERMQDMLKMQAENNQKASKIGSIDSKLKTGKKLTKDDLEYLKENMPDLYEEANIAETERASYEQKLENAKTKDEVEKIKEEKVVDFHGKVKNIMNNTLLSDDKKYNLMMQVHSSLNGVNEVHKEFIFSGNFEKLPREEVKVEVKELQEEVQEEVQESTQEATTEDTQVKEATTEAIPKNQDTNKVDATKQEFNNNINTNINTNNLQADIKSYTSTLSKRLILKS